MVIEKKYYTKNGERQDMSLFGAFPDSGDLLFELEIADFPVESVKLVIHSDGMASCEGEKYYEYELTKGKSEGIFHTELSLEKLSLLSDNGLFYYRYDIKTGGEIFRFGGEEVTVLADQQKAGDRQLLIYDSNFSTPDFVKGGIMYHIFVDRFATSGKFPAKDGAKMNRDWKNGIPEFAHRRGAPIKNNEFFGGDLVGAADKLDYIRSLGVNVIYLSPVFDSPSNHKYDTSDYMKVDPMFGGDEALECFVSECRKRGIRVILDGVFNHTGDDSVYFDRYGKYGDNGAYNNRNSPYFDWYFFRHYPDKYDCWWDIKILPKVDSSNKKFREFILGDGGVISKYTDIGVSGFRLDVADELSDAFIDEARRSLKKKGNNILIGEVWEDASNKVAYSKRRRYLTGKQLDSVMNYPLREGVISFVRDGDCDTLKYALETIYRHYPKCVSDSLMNFLSTHDTERIITVLAGDRDDGKSPAELSVMRLTDEQRANGRRMVKCAWTLIATAYGIPSIFYGDEAGLEGYHDPFCRRPFPWGREDAELEDYFTRFGLFRNSQKIFKEGSFRVVSSDCNCFITERFDDKTSLLTVVVRDRALSPDLPADYKCVFDSDIDVEKGAADTIMRAFSSRIYIKQN